MQQSSPWRSRQLRGAQSVGSRLLWRVQIGTRWSCRGISWVNWTVASQSRVVVGEANTRWRSKPVQVLLATLDHHFSQGQQMRQAGGRPWTSGGVPKSCVLQSCSKRGNPLRLTSSHIYASGQKRVFILQLIREPSNIFLKVSDLSVCFLE